jgi:hypothetical protein
MLFASLCSSKPSEGDSLPRHLAYEPYTNSSTTEENKSFAASVVVGVQAATK